VNTRERGEMYDLWLRERKLKKRRERREVKEIRAKKQKQDSLSFFTLFAHIPHLFSAHSLKRDDINVHTQIEREMERKREERAKGRT
jgi:hypothetical protein